MTDIVDRLRAETDGATVNPDGIEAADEIELLRVENERLHKEIRGLIRTLGGLEIVIDKVSVHVDKLRDLIP